MIIYNVNVVLKDRVIPKGSIEVINGVIVGIYESGIHSSGDINGNGLNLFPGFIDIHSHGGYGHDFCEANMLPKICSNLVLEGITTVYPTTLTMELSQIKNVLDNLNKTYNYVGSKVNGIHLEGPYLSVEKKGAHNPKYLIKPSINELDLVSNNVKIVSYAIEKDEYLSFTKYLSDNNIVASVAHSNALCRDVGLAIDKGLKSVTHIFNGQSGVMHRDGGVAQAGLIYDELYTEVIADLVHLDKECLQLIYKCKPANKIVLVTDSMQAKGLRDGRYKLGDFDVNLQNNQVRLESGSLAGSALKMPNALKNFMSATNCSLSELSMMGSTNAAYLLNEEKIGSIEIGKLADLVLLDLDFNVIMTFIEGRIVYNTKDIISDL